MANYDSTDLTEATYNTDIPLKTSQKDMYFSSNYVGVEKETTIIGGSTVSYRMRGYDSTLSRIVFWTSTSIDQTASQYAGPGPVSDIIHLGTF